MTEVAPRSFPDGSFHNWGRACTLSSFLLKKRKAQAENHPLKNVQPAAHGMHVASDGYECGQHKIVNLLKAIFYCSPVFICVCVFNGWPKTTLLLPVWPTDAKSRMPLLHDAKQEVGSALLCRPISAIRSVFQMFVRICLIFKNVIWGCSQNFRSV